MGREVILDRNAITLVLVAVNLAVYAYASIIGSSVFVIDISVLMWLGQVNLLVMNGYYWQLLTSMFIHVNLLHLVFNMIFLLIHGVRAEKSLGETTYLFTYISSGLVGNISTLVFMGLNTITVSAGASGALFGIVGAYMTYLGARYDATMTPYLVYCLLLLMLNISVNINLIAHVGGLASGLIVGYIKAKAEK